MLMGGNNYIDHLYCEKKFLQKHGLDSWPLEQELAKYVLDLEDKIDVLCRHLKVVIEKDYRGSWVVVPDEEGT